MANGTIIVAAGTEDTHDLCIGDDGQIITLSGIEAYAQVINCNMRTILGEKQLDLRSGIPYMQTIFSNPNMVAVWEAEVRRMLNSLPFVLGIRSFDTEVSDGVLRYKAVIETDLGDHVLTGRAIERDVIDSNFIRRKIASEDRHGSSRIITFATGEDVIPIPQIILEPGKYIYLPSAVKEGADFVGWYTDEELTKPFSSSVMPDKDITLYPKFDTWTEFEIEIRRRFEYDYFGHKRTITYSEGHDFHMRICATIPGEVTTIDWGDGQITQGIFNRSFTQYGSDDGTLVRHHYDAPGGTRFRIRISSNCFKFVIGDFDPSNYKISDEYLDFDAMSNHHHTMFSHIQVSRLLRWSDGIKNAYRTFSGCVFLSGNIPNFPKGMGARVPGSNCEGYQCCGGAFEYTNISNIIDEWPEGMTVINHCFAWTDNASGSIPILPPSITNCKRTFYKALKAKPTPRLEDESTAAYLQRIMPSTIQTHDDYVKGVNDRNVTGTYYESWGGTLTEGAEH